MYLLYSIMNQAIHKLPNKIVEWLDPKLDKYRPHLEKHESYTPTSLADLMGVLKRTPRSVLSNEERQIIVAAMTFKERRVRDIMLPKKKMTFVYEQDFLGPLMLDKLYRSGLAHFPVIGKNGRIVGVVHTDAMNRLEIRENDRASEYLDPNIYYLRDDYTLQEAMAAFLRTNCFFFLVINQLSQVVGMVTYDMMVEYILGEKPEDNFTQDENSVAVAHRK